MSPSNPSPQPTDSHTRLPRSRRLLWEHAEDVRVANTWLTMIAVVLALANVIQTCVLLSIFKRPPAILQEDAGFVMWRTADVYRLRSDIIKTYIGTTLGALLEVHPGAYDLTKLDGLVDVSILKKYSDDAQSNGENRLEKSTRRLFAVYEMRRWVNPSYPQYIAIAVRGEKVIYEEFRDDLGNVRVTPKNTLTLYVVYLKQQTPTPRNPWGIMMVGIQEMKQQDQEKTWADSFPIEGSKDNQGNLIKNAKPNTP
jgi:hypothetical protein